MEEILQVQTQQEANKKCKKIKFCNVIILISICIWIVFAIISMIALIKNGAKGNINYDNSLSKIAMFVTVAVSGEFLGMGLLLTLYSNNNPIKKDRRLVLTNGIFCMILAGMNFVAILVPSLRLLGFLGFVIIIVIIVLTSISIHHINKYKKEQAELNNESENQ